MKTANLLCWEYTKQNSLLKCVSQLKLSVEEINLKIIVHSNNMFNNIQFSKTFNYYIYHYHLLPVNLIEQFWWYRINF